MNDIKSAKAFTLIEVLIYTSITAIVAGLLTGLLLTVSQIYQKESASTEVGGQMNFIIQRIGQLIRESSNIEIDAGFLTSTLKLRMKDLSKDPTCISLVDGAIKLAEGPGGSNNCASTVSDLTNSRVVVDNLTFKKFTAYPGHDTVSIDIQMTYNSENPKSRVQRSLSSGIARVSAATFDSDVVPGGAYGYTLGQQGAPWQKVIVADGTAANPSYTFANNTGLGLFRAGSNILGFTSAGLERMRIDAAGNVGIGTTAPNAKLDVNGTFRATGTTTLSIANNFSNRRMVVSDISGSLAYRDLENPISILDAPFGEYVMYTPTTNNVLFTSNRRFTVTQTGFSAFNESLLFNGNYDDGNTTNVVPEDATGTININLIDKGEFGSSGLTYSYGWIYVHFYANNWTPSVKARLKTKNGGTEFIWRDYVNGIDISTGSSRRVMKIPLSNNYYCSDIEIVITADTVNSSNTKNVWVSEIEFIVNRSAREFAQPIVNKGLNNSIYGSMSFKDGSNVTKVNIYPGNGDMYTLGKVGIGTSTPATLFTVATSTNIFNVLSSGNVGIGTAAPEVALHVAKGGITVQGYATLSTGGAGMDLAYDIGSDTGLIRTRTSAGGGQYKKLAIHALRVGIRRTPTTNMLEVEGNASKSTAGDWLANSDKRIKTDIQDIDNALNIISRLRPVKFKYTNEYRRLHPSIEDKYYYNFIAQEYQEVFPESVKGSGEYLEGADGEILQTDAYNAQIFAIKAIKELKAENDALKKRIEILEIK